MQLSTTAAARLRDTYGPWALVTGASSGIGRELTHQLAGAKFNLILVARRERVLTALAKELAAKHEVKIEIIGADLSDPAEVERVINQSNSFDVGPPDCRRGLWHVRIFFAV